jgi:predicted 3-demethylubiquinone-9 3-methyltransferase (glyoxalase superfamily)
MPITSQKINPCLWFDTAAEDAARFYCSVFKNSKMGKVSRYVDEGQEIHGKPAGSVMAVEFELEGQKFAALNGGPQFTFDEASRFKSPARTRRRSTISGASLPKAERKSPAAG